jgi:hypothetical protein
MLMRDFFRKIEGIKDSKSQVARAIAKADLFVYRKKSLIFD